MTEGGRSGTYLALVLVQVIFGLHYFAAKQVLREIPPEAWAAIRALAAAVLLLALALLARRPLPLRPRTLLALTGLSLFGVVINQLMFVKGLALTRTTHSSLIMVSIPVLTLGIALLLGHERAGGLKLLSLGLALAGVLVLVLARRETFSLGWDDEILRGDLYTLINGSSFALFLVLSRPVLRDLDSLGATAVAFVPGSLVLLAIGASSLARLDPAAIGTRTWALAAYIVVFPTAVAYILQFFALRRVESSLVALFIYLQFVIAALIGVLFLGEPLERQLVLAAALVMAGLALGARAQRRVVPEG
jgi:drug/metabolite transporter (DMT)-like permease